MAVLYPNRFTDRWYPLKPVPEQIKLVESAARFRVCPAGRRSGKTERAKRFLLEGDPARGFYGALTYERPFTDGWFIKSAPTHNQAKRIFWKDLGAFVPKKFIRKTMVSELSVQLINSVEITVMGMDKPERAEGRSIDGILLDEYANMKKSAWAEHVRPGLDTEGRPGWAWLTGVPEGRNHYYDLYMYALNSGDPEWSAHTWTTDQVVAKHIVDQARREMDPHTFDQEYRGSFITFSGRAYYTFGDHNVIEHAKYLPNRPLRVCFDFNTAPGIAVICQEQPKSLYPELGPEYDDKLTVVLSEVYIPKHSNTPMVCNKIIHEWGDHPDRVIAYGDATGGAKGTTSVDGSDWDIIDKAMNRKFGKRYLNAVPRSNPREKVRVNAMNSRCMTDDGTIKYVLDKKHAPHLQKDFEGVITLEGTAGEIDKKTDKSLTHLTDAMGYYIHAEFPISGSNIKVF